jgi:hypothetical protein
MRGRVNREKMTRAILFPPDGSTFEYGRMFEFEWPDPLSACPGYQIPVGLPVSVQTGTAIQVKAASITDSTSGRAVESCTVDAFNYINPDPVTQTRGRDVLRIMGAAIIIPRRPLSPGDRYAVSIQTLQHDFNWNFAIAPGPHKTPSIVSNSPAKPARRRAAPPSRPVPASRVW